MATDTYSEATAHYAETDAHETRRGYADVGAKVFVWLAWAVAFAFWVFSMSIDAGIMRAIMAGGHNTLRGGVDAGGASYLIIYVFGGLIGLGVAIAYGAAQWATRDKRLDARTEAATAEIYDQAERGVPPYGAPGTRRGDNDAYRPA